MAFNYIALHYLKYFAIILIALVLFLVGFDYLGSAEKLELSANLLLIYLVYKAFYAIDLVLPLALVFAMISTKVALVRSNALISLYSLGYSQRDLLKPFIVSSLGIIAIFIALHSLGNFARAEEYAKNIRNHAQYLNPSKDLFFTHKNRFVYFGELLPLQEIAKDIRVFTLKDGSLKEVIMAKSARFKDNHWIIADADLIIKPDDITSPQEGIEVLKEKDLKILEGFRPKMLDQIYEGKVNFSIGDALDAYFLLKNEGINTDYIKSSLYKIFVHPFFAPLLIVIIFFFVPISPRFANLAIFSFVAIGAALASWAVLFTLSELASHKSLSSELAILLPTLFLFIIAVWQYKKHHTFE
ncbi:MAG: LptF/LptG family permease [Sulfuricurvum sp.]